MNFFYRLVWVFIFLPCTFMHGQNAPVTTAGNVSTLADSVTVPITVTGFSDIGSCSLQLMYDPAIALATAVTSGPLLGGSFNVNLSNPGQIILGWYAWPGVSLPDSSVIFNVEFLKVATGASALTWFDDGYSCYYSAGDFTILNDLPTNLYYINGSLAFQTKAPVTIAPSIRAGLGSPIDIPVKVAGFKNIGKAMLTMHFDPVVMTFQSGTNTSGFPGLMIEEAQPGIIQVLGSVDTTNTSGFTLADSSVLLTLNCLYHGGNTGLNWKMDGGSCNYFGPPPQYSILMDVPEGIYYLNGTVAPSVGIDEPDPGDLSIRFYPNPFKDHGTLSWYAKRPGRAIIGIYDITGRLVQSSLEMDERPGEHTTAISIDRLLPGIYTVKVMLDTMEKQMTSSIKIVCVRD